MTANRNTILVLGLTLLALTAGKSALGTPPAACGATSGEASCGNGGSAAGEADCNSSPNPDCSVSPTDPFLGACTSYTNELREICNGCAWKAEASALILTRSSPGTRTVLTDSTSGADLVDAGQLQFPFAAGPRVSLTALDCQGWGIEVNYFGIDGWSASANAPSGTANLAVDSVISLPLTNGHFESTAALYSGEVNFRKPLFGNFSGLAGFRWLELKDKYSVEGIDANTGNAAYESILTHNHLYGFQIGADGTLAKQADRWRLTGFLKAGIFFNDADQATALNDPNGQGNLAVNNNQHCPAFFGEAGLIGYFQITKHLAASGGYQVMFVDGVAQPVNQIPGTNLANSTASLDVSSGLFYHGASVGLEVTW